MQSLAGVCFILYLSYNFSFEKKNYLSHCWYSAMVQLVLSAPTHLILYEFGVNKGLVCVRVHVCAYIWV